MTYEKLAYIFNAYTVNGYGGPEAQAALIRMLETDPVALEAAKVLAERMEAPLAAAVAARKAADVKAAEADIARRNALAARRAAKAAR
jgi:hypothetical protein